MAGEWATFPDCKNRHLPRRCLIRLPRPPVILGHNASERQECGNIHLLGQLHLAASDASDESRRHAEPALPARVVLSDLIPSSFDPAPERVPAPPPPDPLIRPRLVRARDGLGRPKHCASVTSTVVCRIDRKIRFPRTTAFAPTAFRSPAAAGQFPPPAKNPGRSRQRRGEADLEVRPHEQPRPDLPQRLHPAVLRHDEGHGRLHAPHEAEGRPMPGAVLCEARLL